MCDNSTPYKEMSVIKLLQFDQTIELGLEQFHINYLSCRRHSKHPEIAVSKPAINWLREHNIPFRLLVEDLQSKIQKENEYANLIRSRRQDGDWYSTYRKYDEVMDKLQELADSSSIATPYPPREKEDDVGLSYDSRAINGIKLSTGGENKPAVFFNGCQHAREWVTVMATTYIADKLVSDYLSDDPFTQALLNAIDVYIVPIVNPDGYVYTHTTDRYWRKNRQPNKGSQYIGTDLNRNWDADWNGGESTSTTPSSDVYVGTSPFSATETLVVKNYMESIPNLRGHLDIHSYSALVLGPWGYKNTQTPDHAEVVSLGNAMNDAITNTNGYPFTFGTGDANGALYLASGTMPDWTYDSLATLDENGESVRTFGYTYELRPASASEGGFELPEAQILDACTENYNGVREMMIWASNIQAGCTDVNACNYDNTATIDDGSCTVFDKCGECGGDGALPGFDCDGNCLSGENLTLTMSDSYGDGWNGSVITIGGNTFTLNSGSEGTAAVCVDSTNCIEVECTAGEWPGEISWTIDYNGTELLTGGAPFTGTFGNCDPCAKIDCATNYTCVDGECVIQNQTIDIPSGWSIFSTYMIPEDNLETIFSGIDNIIIKNNEGNIYWPTFELNNIGDMVPGQGYQIKTNNSFSVDIFGTLNNVPIALTEGWNMIGYLNTEASLVPTVLSNIKNDIILVKDYKGDIYYPAWGLNTIGNMEPGKGYWIKVNKDVTLIW